MIAIFSLLSVRCRTKIRACIGSWLTSYIFTY
nr:MAG TPA: hypothetical protein [Caudoviricetes sp.]